jgi:hypothetical protein
MKNKLFSSIFILACIGVLGSCGDASDLLPGGDQYKIDVVSLVDGDVLVKNPAKAAGAPSETNGNYIFFRVRGDENKSGSLKLLIDLYNAYGETVAHSEKASPGVNVDLPIEISPRLADGQYELVLTLMKGDTLLINERRTFFLISEALNIQGILSFPLVILPSRSALLIAELNEPGSLDPYFKWTDGKNVIARGSLSEGYNQILWEAPKQDGVYSITVQVFPFPPATGNDFQFKSPYVATSELFISNKDHEKVQGRPDSVHYNLFDIYISALREREKIAKGAAGNESDLYPKNLKRPYPVIFSDSIGMRFNGQAGFICPELIFPMRSNSFAPFTLSLGMTLEGSQAGRQILSLVTYDDSFSIDYFFDKESELVLRLKVKNEEFFFPSGIKKLESGIRYLVDFSITPENGRLRVEWNLNGGRVSQTEKAVTLDQGDKKGYTVIGGENGIRCVVDTLDIIRQ